MNTIDSSEHNTLVLKIESQLINLNILHAGKCFDGIIGHSLRNVESVNSVSFEDVSKATNDRDLQRIGILNNNTTSRNLSGYSSKLVEKEEKTIETLRKRN